VFRAVAVMKAGATGSARLVVLVTTGGLVDGHVERDGGAPGRPAADHGGHDSSPRFRDILMVVT
jgi:hypothetical protein